MSKILFVQFWFLFSDVTNFKNYEVSRRFHRSLNSYMKYLFDVNLVTVFHLRNEKRSIKKLINGVEDAGSK